MTVYGEEEVPLDISKGMFLSPTPDYLPTGYTQETKNFFKTARNTWAVRKGFQEVQSVADSSMLAAKWDVTTYIPEYDKNTIYFGSLGNTTYSSPQNWFIYKDPGGVTSSIAHFTGRKNVTDSVEKNVQAIGFLYSSLVNYLDRIYAAFENTVYRLSNFKYDGTAPAITETSIISPLPSSPNSGDDTSKALLVAYENRIFHFRYDRVNYSDIPTAGGYPETWPATNFFDLIGVNSVSPQIYNAFVIQGILYIFTNQGIWSLNGKGSTSNWTLTFLTDSIKITSRNSAAIIGGTVIATDKRKTYSFNGSSVQEIGLEAKFLYEVYNSFSICPFLDGFILAGRNYVNSSGWTLAVPTGATSTVWPECMALYFDGEVWTKIVHGESGPVDFLYGCTGKTRSSNYSSNLSFLVGRSYTGSDKFNLMYYDRLLYRDVDVSSTNSAIVASIRTADNFNGVKTMRVKRIVSRVFSLIAGVTMYTRISGASTIITTDTPTIADAGDNNYSIESKGPGQCYRFNVEIIPTLSSNPSGFDSDNPDTIPLFEVKSITAMMDSDGREQGRQQVL